MIYDMNTVTLAFFKRIQTFLILIYYIQFKFSFKLFFLHHRY